MNIQIKALSFSCIIISLLLASQLYAGSLSNSKKASLQKNNTVLLKKRPMGAQLGTEYNVDEMAVHGRYESSLAGVATVENEKRVRELIDYRSDYKRRLQKSLTQY
jgi:hypothetical protein